MQISFSTTTHVKRKRRPHRPYRKARRHYRGRERAAVIRAFTAAKLYLDGAVPTLVAAATACGSNIHYVRAAITLIKAENFTLVGRAARGHVNLLKAAEEVRPLAGLVKAYRAATAEDHVAFAKIVGPATVFDTMVGPAI